MSFLELNQHVGRFGQGLYQLARGIDDRPVNVNHQRKSVTVETTFASDLSLNQAEHALNDLIKRLKLRLATNTSTSMAIKALVIKLKFYDFQCVSCELQYQRIDIHLYRQLLYKAYLRHNKMIRLLGWECVFSSKVR